MVGFSAGEANGVGAREVLLITELRLSGPALLLPQYENTRKTSKLLHTKPLNNTSLELK